MIICFDSSALPRAQSQLWSKIYNTEGLNKKYCILLEYALMTSGHWPLLHSGQNYLWRWFNIIFSSKKSIIRYEMAESNDRWPDRNLRGITFQTQVTGSRLYTSLVESQVCCQKSRTGAWGDGIKKSLIKIIVSHSLSLSVTNMILKGTCSSFWQ